MTDKYQVENSHYIGIIRLPWIQNFLEMVSFILISQNISYDLTTIGIYVDYHNQSFITKRLHKSLSVKL